MRLINVKLLCVEEFNESDIPPYAILSHTWGADEVSFQEMQADLSSRPSWKFGYNKIIGTCDQARQDGIEYAWVDTCCIDKTSSAELSEAINSMFRWYMEAKVCYAFLSDIFDIDKDSIVKSRWLTRGWTLQELIAPRSILFYTAGWERIGTRQEVAESISTITGIDRTLLAEEGDDRDTVSKLKSFSVAERMCWASKRQTTRTEDQAYCLLGLFDINMPLLYGEGTKAFIRLQEEIIRQVDDVSIFAWNVEGECQHGPGIFWNSDAYSRPNSKPPPRGTLSLVERMGWSHFPGLRTGVLAVAPCCFSQSADLITVGTKEQYSPSIITNRGIQLNLRVWKNPESGQVEYAILYCRRRSGHAASLLALPLVELPGNRFEFQRVGARWEVWPSNPELERAPIASIFFVVRPAPPKFEMPTYSVIINTLPSNLTVEEVSDGWEWNAGTRLILPRHRFSELVVTLARILPATNTRGSIKLRLDMTRFRLFWRPLLPVIRCELQEGGRSRVFWVPQTVMGRFICVGAMILSSRPFTRYLSIDLSLAERTFLGQRIFFLDISRNKAPESFLKRIPIGLWYAVFFGPMFVVLAHNLSHPDLSAVWFVETAVYGTAIGLIIIFNRG